MMVNSATMDVLIMGERAASTLRILEKTQAPHAPAVLRAWEE
jgi:hypothetical protein